MNNMIVRIHRFEILNAQLAPLVGSLRKDNCLLLFITLPMNPTTSLDLPQHLLRREVWVDMAP
jgi:hypothetical protein